MKRTTYWSSQFHSHFLQIQTKLTHNLILHPILHHVDLKRNLDPVSEQSQFDAIHRESEMLRTTIDQEFNL